MKYSDQKIIEVYLVWEHVDWEDYRLREVYKQLEDAQREKERLEAESLGVFQYYVETKQVQ